MTIEVSRQELIYIVDMLNGTAHICDESGCCVMDNGELISELRRLLKAAADAAD